MVSDCHTDLPRSMYTFSLYRLLYESTVIDRPSSKPENCFFVRLKSLNGQNKAKGTEHVALAQRGICSSKLQLLGRCSSEKAPACPVPGEGATAPRCPWGHAPLAIRAIGQGTTSKWILYCIKLVQAISESDFSSFQ